MTAILQSLTIVGVAVGLAVWGLWRGRREREAERSDPRQRQMPFDQQTDHEHRGAAMSMVGR